MKRIIRNTALALGTTLAVSSLAVGAAEAKPDPGGSPCGFYTAAGNAYYNHCWYGGSGDRYILVLIDSKGGGDAICVAPGSTYMGPASVITGVTHKKGDKSCLT